MKERKHSGLSSFDSLPSIARRPISPMRIRLQSTACMLSLPSSSSRPCPMGHNSTSFQAAGVLHSCRTVHLFPLHPPTTDPVPLLDGSAVPPFKWPLGLVPKTLPTSGPMLPSEPGDLLLQPPQRLGGKGSYNLLPPMPPFRRPVAGAWREGRGRKGGHCTWVSVQIRPLQRCQTSPCLAD